MHVLINDIDTELEAGATLADAVARAQPKPPFAAAINKRFVPRSAYAATALASNDKIELISPVTGG